jgi:uncharacterized protein (TIRG00374 family)
LKKQAVNIIKFFLFLGLGVGILYLVYKGQNAAFQEDCALKGVPASDCSLIAKVIDDFRNANYFWIFIVLIAFIISNISRAIRWNMLIHPLGYRPRLINSFLAIVIGYFANLGIPRMGEVVRAGTLASYEKIGVEKVMGTIVVDRIVDVISLLTLTALAVLFEFDTITLFVNENVSFADRLGGLQRLVLYGILAFVFVLGLFYIFRKPLMTTALFKKVIQLIEGFVEGLRTISKLDRPWLFVFHSVNIWLMYFMMTYMCFFAFAPTSHLSPLVGLVVFVFGGWGIVVPSPGGMGTYHFMVQTALQMYGVAGDDAFSFANIAFFSISLGVNVLLGIIGLIILPLINKGYHPGAPLTE